MIRRRQSQFTRCGDAAISGLYVLVNSAGILVSGDTASLKWSDYDRCMDINTKAAFVLTQEAIPHLVKTKGNLVHVSSVTGMQDVVLLAVVEVIAASVAPPDQQLVPFILNSAMMTT